MLDVCYGQRFLKDVARLKGCSEFTRIKRLCFEELPSARCFDDLASVKKLAGFADYYRIRVGDYRVGFKFHQGTVTFLRVLHRKEIYRYFP